jgi:hypothetical protein
VLGKSIARMLVGSRCMRCAVISWERNESQTVPAERPIAQGRHHPVLSCTGFPGPVAYQAGSTQTVGTRTSCTLPSTCSCSSVLICATACDASCARNASALANKGLAPARASIVSQQATSAQQLSQASGKDALHTILASSCSCPGLRHYAHNALHSHLSSGIFVDDNDPDPGTSAIPQ